MITNDLAFCKFIKLVFIDDSKLFGESLITVCTYDKEEKIISTSEHCPNCSNKESLKLD